MHPELLYMLSGLLVAALAFWLWRYLRRRPPRTVPFGEMPVRTVEAAGFKIRYHISGRGPHLVLLHGLGANLYCWRWILPRLNTHYTVVVPDLPGFGQSSMPAGAHYGLDDQVPRLQAFLRTLGIERAYWVGNSMGGNIALWFALRHPDQVLGTAVIAPASSPSLMPLMASKLAWLSGPLSLLLTKQAMRWAHRRTVTKKQLVDIDRVEETFKTYGGKGDAIRSFLLATESIRDARLPHALRDLKTPVLILWGSQDKLVSRKVIDDLEAALVASESHVHIGGGHHLQEDEPEWVQEKIDAFFQTRLD
jgi:pimeloyl-ACP methyl ester carboxylesterase